MKTVSSILSVSLLAIPATLSAQTLLGNWQGMRRDGRDMLPAIVKIESTSDGRLTASLVAPNESGFDHSYLADTVRLESRELTVTWSDVHVRYVGIVRADDRSIKGTWTEDGNSVPLELVLSTTRTAWRDSTAHTRRFVAVEKDVRLEVLDWGGSGAPVILLAGNGNTPHVFDQFAPKLTPDFHVYGITRRGFGASSTPVSGYLSDSLADDVLAVMDSLSIRRPVLIGHSLAGQELSSIGSRYPEKVAGLVYLDAGYQYAFYDTSRGNDAQRKPTPAAAPPVARSVREQITSAIAAGHQRYTSVHSPVLAIFALPREAPPAIARDSAKRAMFDSISTPILARQIDAFERGIPSSRVVRLAHANHYVFRSHEADVLREIHVFLTRVAKH